MGHHHHPPAPSQDSAVYSPLHQRYLRLATIASVSVALLLVVLKTGAYYSTGSLSLLSSLVDSLMDVTVSAVNFIAIRYALKPADHDHRHGHNSIEDIAGLMQFTLIAASSAYVLVESFDRLWHPQAIEQSDVGIAVMLISLLATTALVLFQRFVYRATRSSIVAADALHYFSDILSNAAVIAALVLAPLLGWHWLDPIFAIAIAIYIAMHAIEIGKRSYDNLMDKEMPEADKEKIEAIVRGTAGVRGVHALKTRYSGRKAFIQMHVELDGTQTLRDSHAIADALEHSIYEAFPGADVIVHQDPV